MRWVNRVMIFRDLKRPKFLLDTYNGYAATPTAVGEVKNSIENSARWLADSDHVTTTTIDFPSVLILFSS